MLLKKDEASKNTLQSQLIKIDEHLGKRGNRFLTGDTLCCFDCELMPRLQHIRVAGQLPFPAPQDDTFFNSTKTNCSRVLKVVFFPRKFSFQ